MPSISIWQRLKARLRPEPIADAGVLRSFLEQRSSLIAQKCAIDYCKGKTGLASYALFDEKPFLDALEVCRWETFAAVLGDLTLVAEGQLRPHVPAGRLAALHGALEALYISILTESPAPAHRSLGWADEIASFTARLAEAARGEPRRALDVADHSARRLFATLPIHASMRKLDEEVVYGAVRFRMVAVSQELQRRLHAAGAAERLISAQKVTL